ncbi:MAG: YggT family protein [Deltaproteobacteria bacterium]|nr:YggT family protein [Deltaproteobacteria bacterium]
MYVLSNLFVAIAKVLDIGLSLYLWIVIIRALLSWVNPDPYNPIVRFLGQVTDPVFYRIRRWFPWTAVGGIDFAPMLIMLAIFFLQSFLVQSLLQFAQNLAR